MKLTKLLAGLGAAALTAALAVTASAADPLVVWDFSQADNTAFYNADGTVAFDVNNGIATYDADNACLNVDVDGGDPFFILPNQGTFPAENSYVRVKYNLTDISDWSTSIYFTTDTVQWSETGHWKGIFDGDDGEWCEQTFIMTECAAWAGTITDMRLDIFDSAWAGQNAKVAYVAVFGSEEDANAFDFAAWQNNGRPVTLSAAPAAEAPAAEATASAGLPAAYPASGTEVPADSVLIAGELIGNELGWDGTAGSGRASAFDGNVDTFYDPATASVDWCGIDAGEEMILTKIIIRPRTGWTDRFNGATIEASNDPEFEDSVELFFSAEAASAEEFIDCTAEMEESENTGYRYFRYINYMSHGDVAEVELYGKAKDGSNPTYTAAAAEAPAAATEAAPAAASDRVSAVAVGGAGIFTYDESDGEYWSPALTMLDKTGVVMALEDGTIIGYSDVSTYTDATGVQTMATMAPGWYEVVLCNLGTNPEWFPADVKGKVALAVRGDSTFTVKSQNAMDAGAIACLIGNNCRAVELVDETGVMTGEYENASMSVEYYTIPMCALSSDVTARLVAQTADISIADAVVAVENVYFGDLELSVEHKKTGYIFLGTLEEYEANKTRTDANTVTMGGGIAGAAAEEAPAEEAAAETPAVEEANIFATATVVEISGLETEGANTGDMAIDGDITTRWSSNTDDAAHIIVDLGAVTPVDSLDIYWETACAADYTVEVSEDNANWTVVATVTDNANGASPAAGAVSHEWDTVNARYIKINCTRRNTEWGNSIWEMVAYAAEAPVVEEVPAEEPAAEVVEEPVVVEEEVVEAAAEEEAAETFDFAVITVIAAVVSAAGYAISKKR